MTWSRQDSKFHVFALFCLFSHLDHSRRNKLFHPALILIKFSDRYKTYYIIQNRANEVAFHVRIRLRCGWFSLPVTSNARRSKTDWAPVVFLDFITHEIIVTEYKMNFDFIKVFGALLMPNKIKFEMGVIIQNHRTFGPKTY
jgi:hypothetical protein